MEGYGLEGKKQGGGGGEVVRREAVKLQKGILGGGKTYANQSITYHVYKLSRGTYERNEKQSQGRKIHGILITNEKWKRGNYIAQEKQRTKKRGAKKRNNFYTRPS